MSLIWSRKAEANLVAILTYVVKDDAVAARRFVDDIVDSTELVLSQYPLSGQPGRIDGTREWVAHKRYVVVYRAVGDSVTVPTVRHTSPQWPKAVRRFHLLSKADSCFFSFRAKCNRPVCRLELGVFCEFGNSLI